jgi:hypothetical protein
MGYTFGMSAGRLQENKELCNIQIQRHPISTLARSISNIGGFIELYVSVTPLHHPGEAKVARTETALGA